MLPFSVMLTQKLVNYNGVMNLKLHSFPNGVKNLKKNKNIEQIKESLPSNNYIWTRSQSEISVKICLIPPLIFEIFDVTNLKKILSINTI